MTSIKDQDIKIRPQSQLCWSVSTLCISSKWSRKGYLKFLWHCQSSTNWSKFNQYISSCRFFSELEKTISASAKTPGAALAGNALQGSALESWTSNQRVLEAAAFPGPSPRCLCLWHEHKAFCCSGKEQGEKTEQKGSESRVFQDGQSVLNI